MNRAQKIYQKLTALKHCWENDNTEWILKHSEELQDLENELPSGSGFNGVNQIVEFGDDYDITQLENEKFHIYTEYHCMNDNGFYCGWVYYTFEVTPSFHTGYYTIATVEWVNESDFDDDYVHNAIDDYIVDCIHEYLNTEVD